MPHQSFKRRTFVKLLGGGLGAAFASWPQMLPAFAPEESSALRKFVLGKPEWILHEDGTFDIYAGSIRLTNCRPTINGQSIFVRNTFVGDSPKGKRIIYEIEGGFIMLDLRTHTNTISIGTEISGMRNAPAWVNPLGEGYIVGANHFFKQGFGTGGKSGIFGFRQPSSDTEVNYPDEGAWSFDSFLITGLVADNGDTLAIGAYEHGNFIQRSSIYNRLHRRGLNDTRPGKEPVFFESGFVTEEIPLKDEFLRLPDLFVYYGNQPFGTLQSLAWNISEQNQARRDTDTNYFWSSYQDFRTSFSYKYLLGQLKILDEVKPPVPIQTVLVGPGYCVPGDWMTTSDTWPKSMDDVARQIFQRRYRAGIYVAPFVAHEKSRVFRVHPHWILKDREDKPIQMGEDANGRLYALDAANDDVRDYIVKIFRTFRKMGFTYYELDYLDYGLQDASEIRHGRKAKSSVQTFRVVMDLIREEIGAGSFVTANRAPYAPLIGYVDAVRIDRDQSWKWNETTRRIIDESYNTQYFNNIFWQNDPDVVFLRNYKNEYTDEEQKSLALWNGILGGAIGTSDNFSAMESEKLRLWRFLEPVKRPWSATLPYWGYKIHNKVVVRRYPDQNGWGVLILNDTEQTVSESYPVADLTGLKEANIFFWEPGFSMGLGLMGKITVILGPHESKLFYLSEVKENPPLNLTLSGKNLDED